MLPVAAAAAAAAPAAAAPECACVDPYAPPWAAVVAPYTTADGGLRAVDGRIVRRGYGSGRCAAHDADPPAPYGFPECRSPHPPKWCAAEWCYVNGTQCSDPPWRPSTASVNFPGLSFSFGTCGFSDTYSTDHHIVKMRDRTAGVLRASIPADSVNRQYLHTDEHGHPDGLLPAFFNHVAKRLDVDLRTQPITHASWTWAAQEASNNSYEACVHDVAIGAADLCIGPFWDTAYRWTLADMTTPVTNDNFYLVVSTKDHGTIWDKMTWPFQPFHWSLWLLLAGEIIVVGLLFLLLYNIQHHDVLEDPTCPIPSLGITAHTESCLERDPDMLTWKDEDKEHHHRAKDGNLTTMGILSAVARSIHVSMACLIGASGIVLGYRPGKKINRIRSVTKVLVVTQQFFGIFILTLYTASAVALMVNPLTHFAVHDIGDAIRANYTICAYDILHNATRFAHPGIQLAKTLDGHKMLAMLGHAGSACNAALILDKQLRQWHGRGEFCELQIVGPAVMTIPVAVPVATHVASSVSWEIAKGRNAGTVSKLERAFPIPPPACAGRGTSTQLSAGDFAGLAFLVGAAGVCVVVGAVVNTACGLTPDTKVPTVGTFVGKVHVHAEARPAGAALQAEPVASPRSESAQLRGHAAQQRPQLRDVMISMKEFLDAEQSGDSESPVVMPADATATGRRNRTPPTQRPPAADKTAQPNYSVPNS